MHLKLCKQHSQEARITVSVVHTRTLKQADRLPKPHSEVLSWTQTQVYLVAEARDLCAVCHTVPKKGRLAFVNAVYRDQ